MPVGPLQLRIDLIELARREPETAQYGQWLNDNSTSGVDLDGDTRSLSFEEFMRGAERMSAAYPTDLAVRANISRLYELFMERASGGVSQSWQSALGVKLQTFAARAGPACAFGGFTLERRQTSGLAIIALPTPTPTARQTVDTASAKLLLVDDQGQPLTAAITKTRFDTTNPDKHVLLVELDLAKLPSSAHLRWQIQATVSDAPIDLTTPVPLPTNAELPPETKEWLGSAPMIQTSHPTLRALAAKARAGAADVQTLVKNTLQVMAGLRRFDWQAAPPNWQNDALSLAQTGFGECVANSNLFAALMRINGVPTRIVSGITRGNGYPINMHYRNEYFVPGKGWVYLEPQGQDIQIPRVDMVETGRISAAMEQHGNGFEHYKGVIAGTMIATDVSPGGAKVAISSGLFTPTPSIAGASLALHGAN